MSNGIDGDTNNRLSIPVGEFGGYLYVSTYSVGGTELWRSSDGVSWDRVNNDGFNEDANNWVVFGMEEFKGGLYAEAFNTNGVEVWRQATEPAGAKLD